MSSESRTVGTAMATELPDGRKFLTVAITIDCPVCGQLTLQLAGHHLRALREFLTSTIDEFPDLCLKEGDVRALETLRFEGRVTNPENN